MRFLSQLLAVRRQLQSRLYRMICFAYSASSRFLCVCKFLIGVPACWCDAYFEAGYYPELVTSSPSWNTDQGVHLVRESFGCKPNRRSESNTVRPLSSTGPSQRTVPLVELSFSDGVWSVQGETRKMVNYAWVGWNQRKRWWRSEVILTCKSITKLGYRGERLIEPSSSWFPSKFPSG